MSLFTNPISNPMSQPKPIDEESLNELDNEGDTDYISASDVSNDKGLWKVGNRFYPIDEMDREFLQTAYYHALKKVGEHAETIQQSQKAVRKFLTKMQELEEEAENRDLDQMIPVSPEAAVRQVLDPDANTTTSNDPVNA